MGGGGQHHFSSEIKFNYEFMWTKLVLMFVHLRSFNTMTFTVRDNLIRWLASRMNTALGHSPDKSAPLSMAADGTHALHSWRRSCSSASAIECSARVNYEPIKINCFSRHHIAAAICFQLIFSPHFRLLCAQVPTKYPKMYLILGFFPRIFAWQ